MNNNNYRQSNARQDELFDLLKFLNVLRKHFKYLIAGLLIGALAGWAFANYAVPKKYRSYVDLYITNKKELDSDSVNYNDLSSAQKLAETYAVILQSSEVTQNVMKRIPGRISADELLKGTSFTSVQNTEVLRINVQTKDPELSKDVCDAYMLTAQEALDSIVGAGAVKVISKPQVFRTPSSPSIPQYTVIGGAIGLLLMVAVSFLRMIDSRRITDEKMLAETYSFPVLGSVPDFFQFSRALGISKGDVKKSQKLKEKNPNNVKIKTLATVLSDNTPFPIREAYNGIRSNILFSLSNMKNGIIVVTSPCANDLKTTTSINLAITLAQIGAKVLLIDSDLRNPSVFRQLKTSNQKGLSKVVVGRDRFENAVVRNVAPGMDFLSAGPSTQRPSELLGSGNMMRFLKKQAYFYDFVILDTSPLDAVSDSLSLASVAAGYILVVRENKTTMDELEKAVRAIQMANGSILGLVLTDADISKGGYGYGKYGYGYGYGEEGKKKKQ